MLTTPYLKLQLYPTPTSFPEHLLPSNVTCSLHICLQLCASLPSSPPNVTLTLAGTFVHGQTRTKHPEQTFTE